jgi:demethylmenaquinone methyltransferase/2-methoxy-6-polyprenyl-1,4-benzoquinol methylase/phosphoethanolamine N-methyltransferase
MSSSDTAHAAPQTNGMVIRWARFYDVAVQLISLGRETALREQTVAIAKIHPGERVLDIGCGTGTLAIAVARAVPGAEIRGLDPAPSMVERARHKAAVANVDVEFDVGVIERMDIEDDSVDVVLSSLMLHHLPGTLRQEGLREVHRVLKPGGRLVAVDFFGRIPLMHHLASVFRGRHSHSQDQGSGLVSQLRELGFNEPRRERMKPGYLSSFVAFKPQ